MSISIFTRTTGYWLLLPLLLGGCQDKNTYVPPPPPEVAVARPVRQRVSDHFELTGTTQAVKTVQLVARVQGYLEKVFFHDGDLVKAGQPLFLIQQNTYRARLQQAEAQVQQQKAALAHAQTELNRFSGLVSQQAAAQTDLDNWRFQRNNARAALRNAEAARDLARLELGYTQVNAPFSGRIGRRLRDPGNLVGAGEFTPLAEINQIDPVYVYFTINESDLLRVIRQTNISPAEAEKMNIPAALALSGESDYPHPCRLDFTAITVTANTGTLQLRSICPNKDNAILPGLFARVRLLIINSERMALLVLEEAVGYDQLGPYVLTLDDQNKVRRASVKLGAAVKELRVIDEGLTESDLVIESGLQKAIPGNKVNPRFKSPSDAGPAAKPALPIPAERIPAERIPAEQPEESDKSRS